MSGVPLAAAIRFWKAKGPDWVELGHFSKIVSRHLLPVNDSA